ncbi:MAG: hypothetical protein ACE5GK_04625 [Nitrospiria bacterium]
MKRVYCISMLTAVLLLFLMGPVEAKKMVLVGIPITQTRATIDSSFHVNLDNNQKVSNRLVIVEEDGKYYWKTRDNKELTFKKMKRFHLFIDPETGGYIKVIKQEDGRLVYLEHISFVDFRSFTYWGVVNTYEP